jgi:hypothetical protein
MKLCLYYYPVNYYEETYKIERNNQGIFLWYYCQKFYFNLFTKMSLKKVDGLRIKWWHLKQYYYHIRFLRKFKFQGLLENVLVLYFRLGWNKLLKI